MKLKKWLEKHERSAAWFARKIKVSSVKVSEILNNEKDMLLSIALRIQKETDGEVTVEELIPEKVWMENTRKRKKLGN